MCENEREEGRKEGRNVLFNDALNTFIFGYMASDIRLRTILIAHTTAFVKPVMEHWLEREIAQWREREREMCLRERNV